MDKKVCLLIIPFLLASCSFGNENKDISYLNYKYILNDAGDIHDISPTYGEVLNRDPGFTSYTKLFNKEKSYINFQCFGNNFNNFYCETTFSLVDKDGNVVLGGDNFKFTTKYSGGQSGQVIIEDNDISQMIGKIYVFTPYWCRWQFEYDVNNDGNKTLLTFEFWKSTFNNIEYWS